MYVKKERITDTEDFKKKFLADLWKEDGPLPLENVVFAAQCSNSCPDEMIEKDYRAGKISEEDWQSWLTSLEFCKRYE